jgi:hypothetical protein
MYTMWRCDSRCQAKAGLGALYKPMVLNFQAKKSPLRERAESISLEEDRGDR